MNDTPWNPLSDPRLPEGVPVEVRGVEGVLDAKVEFEAIAIHKGGLSFGEDGGLYDTSRQHFVAWRHKK